MTEITMPFVRCNSGQITWTVEVCSLERFMTPQFESTVVYNTKLASAGSRSIDVVVESVKCGVRHWEVTENATLRADPGVFPKSGFDHLPQM
jgi:hypothetical protein